MNTNPDSIKILAYGDSNTWGRVPGDDNNKRFESNVRWTGLLQELLGTTYEIVEEGLNGRTTHLNSPNKAGKNGKEYLYACLESQKPTDIIILSLGANNLKTKYNQTAMDIANGIEECLDLIEEEGRNRKGVMPVTILVPPICIEEIPRIRGNETVVDFKGGKVKSLELPKLYKEIASTRNIKFADWNEVAIASAIDGIHLEDSEHTKIAKFFYSKIKGIDL